MNYKISEHLRIRGIVSGTYARAIPEHQKTQWNKIKHKHEEGQTLTSDELAFLQNMNAYTSKRYAARQRARNCSFANVADKFYNPAKRI